MWSLYESLEATFIFLSEGIASAYLICRLIIITQFVLNRPYFHSVYLYLVRGTDL